MVSENMLSDASISDAPSIDTVTTTMSPEIEVTEAPSQAMSDSSSFDSLLKKIDLSRSDLLEIALYFGGGILCGFFVKKYHQYLIVMGFVLLALVVAHLFNIITVAFNADKIQSLLGCQSVPCDITFFSFAMQWIKEHVRASVSFVSGFVIGLWVS